MRQPIDPYSHILVASRTFDCVLRKVREKFPEAGPDSRLREIFYLGSIMPDIGNYPGGEARVSHLAHGLRTWDLTLCMFEKSSSSEELIFAYGWALHVVTDVIGHSEFTNLTHAEIAGLSESYPRGVRACDFPLDHRRTEFGASAYLLGVEGNNFLWDIVLSLPESFENKGRSLVEKAFSRVYGFELNHRALLQGAKGMKKEIKRIPVVMKFLGRIRSNWHEFFEKFMSVLLRGIFVPLYMPHLKKRNDQGAMAVIRPFRLEKNHVERLLLVLDKIEVEFLRALEKDFVGFTNLDLDTGESPCFGRSKSLDLLMEEFKGSELEERFKKMFGKNYLELYKRWEEFEKIFYGGQN